MDKTNDETLKKTAHKLMESIDRLEMLYMEMMRIKPNGMKLREWQDNYLKNKEDK